MRDNPLPFIANFSTLLLLLLSLTTSDAFYHDHHAAATTIISRSFPIRTVAAVRGTGSARFPVLFGTMSRYDAFDNGGGDEDPSDRSFDVEAVRKRLESLLSAGGGDDGRGDKAQEPQNGVPQATVDGTSSSDPSDPWGRPNQHHDDDDHHHDDRNHHHHEGEAWLSMHGGLPTTADYYDDPSLSSLESMLAEVNFPSPPPPPPPLTAIDRERRETEIRLLEQLREGDDALPDLWTLWYHERGPAAAARLQRADELVASSSASSSSPVVGRAEAEAVLRDLVTEFGYHWAEPVHRLATLCYVQGRFDEAGSLCRLVLRVKPWHFGALSGLVTVLAAKRQSDAARFWAGRRLPRLTTPGSPNRRRAAWVNRAVADARRALSSAEDRVREALGRPDDHALRAAAAGEGTVNRVLDPTSDIASDLDSDEDSWQ